MDKMDRQIALALEKKPEYQIPAGFAARVAGQLPVRRIVVVTPTRYGLIASRIGVALLLLALVMVGTHSVSHTVFGVALEWILCAQLIGLSLWLGGVGSFLMPEL
jgi:hypothetical protein